MAIQAVQKTLADPIAAYTEAERGWKIGRAACKGSSDIKALDRFVSISDNLLIPFSPSMTQPQYDFYKSEAEWPGIVSQYAKMLVGGLLRKKPVLTLPDDVPEDANDWIMNQFGQDEITLAAFLDDALWEEMQTGRAWIQVDFPKVSKPDEMTREELLELRPYAILHKAETIINWTITTGEDGAQMLSRLIIRAVEESFDDGQYEFHPKLTNIIWVHEIREGNYRIRKYRDKSDGTVHSAVSYDLEETNENILFNGERLKYIPIWPLNGSVKIVGQMLMPIIDKEIALYNKTSRRNHLLYGAATYTPVIFSDMPDDDFDALVEGGLGTWLRLRSNDRAEILDTPTAALKDMETAIAAHIEEMAKMGIRMLSPESAQSGVALEIRNAAQTSQLGTLNQKVSNQLRSIICFMINWRYGTDYKETDLEFNLSEDFNPVPLGADWLRLATEWYQQGFLPRSIWLSLLKQNDMITPDYDDEEGRKEINEDELIVLQKDQNMDYANQSFEAQKTSEKEV